MKIRFMFAATLLLLPALQLQAQTLDCDNAMTQMEINQCAAQALEQADQELNRVYTQYRAGLQAKDWQALKQVQNVGFAGIELQPQAGRVGDDEQWIAVLLRAEFQPWIQIALDDDASQRAAQGVGAIAGAAEAGQALPGTSRFGLGVNGLVLALLEILVGDDPGGV